MRWSIFFAGDVYFDQPVKGPFLSPELSSLVRRHDLAVCNFEGAMPAIGATPIEKVGPAMAQGEGAMQAVWEAGFHVVSLANNHSYDFGDAGLLATLNACGRLIPVGAGLGWDEAYACKTVSVGNLTIGFLAFSEAQFGALLKPGGHGGYAWIGHPSVEAIVRGARKKVDVLFVQCHAGVEHLALPLPEWREKYRQLITWGADAVIGHHPHVPQGWETYEGKPIFYSLGNFFFPKYPADWGMGVSFTYDRTEFVAFEVHPVALRGGYASIASEQMDELEHRRDALGAGRYEEAIDQAALRLWETVYAQHYRVACSGFAWSSWLRDLKRAILFSPREKQRRLLHNLQIESHLWATARALRLLART